MTALYPLRFQPVYKQTVWGGESWEISGLAPRESSVANGALAGRSLAALVRQYRGALVGETVYARYGVQFPLLIKLIDAHQDLSIQAHPDDHLALIRHNSLGKSEMWYVMQAEPGASVLLGFKRPVTRAHYLETLRRGQLASLLQRRPARAGDLFYVPAGTPHSIGKGLRIAEIQQASDVTYRIDDFGRRDVEGQRRELHIDQSLDALDYGQLTVHQDAGSVACRHFTTRVLDVQGSLARVQGAGSFTTQLCVAGSYTLHHRDGQIALAQGDCVLIPAACRAVTLEAPGACRVLESHID